MFIRKHQTGYLLIPVAIALAVIGVLAFYSANQSALNVSNVASELETTRAEYVAQAGLQHALRHHANQGCGPYSDLTGISLGNDLYTTSLTTTLGSTNTYRVDVDQDTWIDIDNPDVDNSADSKLQIQFNNGKYQRPLLKYDLSAIPAGANVISATAYFYVNKEHPEGPLYIHELTTDWQDNTATWNTMADKLSDSVVATIARQPRKDLWVGVNLTSLVQAWINGQENYGIALDPTFEGINGDYESSERASRKPYITVITGTPPSADAKLKAVGTLADGTSKTLLRDLTLQQNPASEIEWQHDATLGVDTYIWEWTPTTNYGADDEIWVAFDTNNDSRSLLKFAVETIPREANIVNATLSLEHESGNDSDVPITAHRITQHWEEDEATWRRRELGVDWDTNGGDFDGTVFATTEVGPATGQRYEWDLTDMVQGWVDGTFPNYGVALATEMPSAFGERFYSSDETDQTRRPGLRITYRCACGSSCAPRQGSGKVLLLVNRNDPDPTDTAKQSMLEGWGYEVSVLDDWDDSATYNAAMASNDVMFISGASPFAVGSKLNNASIGIVNERGELNDEIGIATDRDSPVGDSIDVVVNDHYITRKLPVALVRVMTADVELMTINGTVAPEAETLAEVGGAGALVTLDTGAVNSNGDNSPARRVSLPAGESEADWMMTSNGAQIVQRSIEWAMGADIVTIGEVLLVVVNPANLTAQEAARSALLQGWGYDVTLIDESDSQANFDAALAGVDVVYIPEDVTASNVNTKLVNSPVGVVTEEANLADEFGFSETIVWGSGTDVKTQRYDYITTTLPLTSSTILTTPESLAALSGARAPDLIVIGESAAGVSLAKLNTGARLFGGGEASGRRVLLPWGGNDMEINHLNDDGRTIMQRSIEWAAGANLPGPIAHWKLDEKTGVVATDSSGDHDGNLTNGTGWSDAILDGGAQFDGVDDAIIVANADTLGLTESMTMTAWARANAYGESGAYDLIISKGTVATSYAYYFGALNDEIIFGFSADGAYREFVTPGLNLATDTWQHLAATFDDRSGLVRLFLDGVEVFRTTTTYRPSVTTHDLYIGSSEDGADWDGVLDDVRIYDRALSPDEIAELARLPGPIAWWKLDETVGPTAVDSEGGHDGTWTNAPVAAPGVDEGGLELDGTDQYVDVPHDDNLSMESFSINAWIRPTALNGWQVIVNKGTTTSAVNYYLATNDDEIGIGFFNGSWREINTSSANLEVDSWYHLVATYDDYTRTGRIYLDGTLIQTDTMAVSPLANSDNLTIGRSGFGEFWPGTLDDVRLYNRVLSDAEVQDIYDETRPPGPGYTELFQQWNGTSNNSWQTVDLAPFGVPANAVVEVAIFNDSSNNEREGGLRAVGSTLQRRFDLHEAEGGGVDLLTLHVQADASAQIQHYSENTGDIRFMLLGYWTGASYTELFETFSTSDDGTWRTRDLTSFGIPENQVVAELVMRNSNGSAERLIGIRSPGSGLNRRFAPHEAEAGGVDAYSMMVNTNEDGKIEVYGQTVANVRFDLVGYWETPPGTYIENASGQWNPSSTGWQTRDLTSIGVPDNAVVNMILANRNPNGERQMGVRAVGSSENRRFDLQEAEAGGADLTTMHVVADGTASIQFYPESTGANYGFMPVGWWVLNSP